MSPMGSFRIALIVSLWIFLLYPFHSHGSEQDQLQLLGTIGTGGSTSKAIIKNHFTGKLKTYSQGDVIALADDEYATITAVSSCIVILKSNLKYETLECNNAPVERTSRIPSPLARFTVLEKKIRDGVVYNNFESRFGNAILSASERYGVDPYLVKAVIKVESNFNPKAVSPKKAMGMMQLIAETASIYGVEDPFDPEDNIDGGVRHLRDLMKYFDGDLELVLSAYNAGKDAVIKYGYGIPPYPETEAYVEKVLAYYNHIKDTRYVSWR
jgi:soluble lytic murein transglycosylase-like protein